MTLGLGVGAGLMMGDRRKADGDGIEICAIDLEKDSQSYKRTLASSRRYERELIVVCSSGCAPSGGEGRWS